MDMKDKTWQRVQRDSMLRCTAKHLDACVEQLGAGPYGHTQPEVLLRRLLKLASLYTLDLINDSTEKSVERANDLRYTFRDMHDDWYSKANK